KLCSDAIVTYKSAQRSLQQATATLHKFAGSTTDNVASSVVSHLKLPPHQTIQGVPDVMDDPRVTAAKTLAEEEISTARSSTTALLSTIYTVQAEKARELVDVTKCADALAAALTEYCVRIITRSEDPDKTAWNPLVSAFKMVFTNELRMLRFELTARLDKEASAKEAKANAVLTARADAEMVDANKPVKEIVDEAVARA
ncbi:hypothetical protein C8R46DRAFT_872147, partial [Mycena filopes]